MKLMLSVELILLVAWGLCVGWLLGCRLWWFLSDWDDDRWFRRADRLIDKIDKESANFRHNS